MQEPDQGQQLRRWAHDQVGGRVDGPDREEAPAEPEQSKELPRIVLPGEGRQVTTFARECALAFNTADTVFQKDGVPVVIDPERGAIEKLDEYGFGTELEKVAITIIEKMVKVGEDTMTVKRPKTTAPTAAKMVLRTREFIFSLRKLERVTMVQQPIQRADGRVELLQPGYDAQSGIYTLPNQVKVDDRFMTYKENGALDVESTCKGVATALRSFLREFPFVSELDLAVQVCAMLSFYGALLLPVNAARLSWLMKANKHRSGKTLLIKMCIIPVMGKAIVQPFPKNEEELKKLLDATAIGGKSYLVLDDISGHLKSGELNGFLTAAHWGGRKMHTQSDFEAKRQAVVFLSGHEITLSPDIGGRVLECRLHVGEADAMKHRVKNVMDDAALEKPMIRSDLCSAMWALIKAWHVGGRPEVFTRNGEQVSVGQRPGFQDWCRVYGGMVMMAGFADPVGDRPDDQSSDPEYDDWLALMKNLADAFQEGDKLQEWTFAQLIEKCIELDAFKWAIQGAWKSDKETKERWFECSDRTQSVMGRMFAEKYNNTSVDLPDGRKLRFGRQGKNRHRRYQVTIAVKA